MLNALPPLFLFAAFALALPAAAEEARTQRSEMGERIQQVERDGGRVLRAERMQREGEDVYRIKVLTPEGRVRVLHDERKREVRQPLRTDRRSLMLRDRAGQATAGQRAPEAHPEPPRGRPAQQSPTRED